MSDFTYQPSETGKKKKLDWQLTNLSPACYYSKDLLAEGYPQFLNIFYMTPGINCHPY